MILLSMISALAAEPAVRDGKTMAVDDWGKMAIYGVGGEAAGPLYLQVHAGDLDGDGAPDDAVLRLACAGGQLRAAHYNVQSPRDSASGMASGKRTHHPVTFVKEWGAATPQLATRLVGYNVKENKGARMAADSGGWTAITLSGADGLCADAATAVKATKSRSNIQNN